MPNNDIKFLTANGTFIYLVLNLQSMFLNFVFISKL